MWAQGLGVVETKTRLLKGNDVLVVVLNQSAAEFDLEASAFDLEPDKTALVDLTVRLGPSAHAAVLKRDDHALLLLPGL